MLFEDNKTCVIFNRNKKSLEILFQMRLNYQSLQCDPDGLLTRYIISLATISNYI